MISILLATHNGERFIKESVHSILQQTYTQFELLIGLNGTNDNTKEILSEFINDDRVKIFEYDEKGKSKTLNKLIAISKYDIISIQDDDDVWEPTKLEEQMTGIPHYDIIGTFCEYIDVDGNITGRPPISCASDNIINGFYSGNNQIINTSAIFKKSEITQWDESIGYDVDGVVIPEDYDFWMKLLHNGYKPFNIPKYLVKHRQHNTSNFNTKRHDIEPILQKYKKSN